MGLCTVKLTLYQMLFKDEILKYRVIFIFVLFVKYLTIFLVYFFKRWVNLIRAVLSLGIGTTIICKFKITFE